MKQTRAQNSHGEGGPDDERTKKTTVRLLLLYCLAARVYASIKLSPSPSDEKIGWCRAGALIALLTAGSTS